MRFDFEKLEARDKYKLLTGVVVPRPIALVTSIDGAGIVNAAPFSFFNTMGSDPPLVALGIGNRGENEPKDTARNIIESGEFVINLVDETIATAMNVCAIDFPSHISELAIAGLTTARSTHIHPPRIAQAPAGLECRLLQTTQIGNNRIIFGEVLCLHISDELIDLGKLYFHAEKMRLVGRMPGADGYLRTSDTFAMTRQTYEEWRTSRDP